MRSTRHPRRPDHPVDQSFAWPTEESQNRQICCSCPARASRCPPTPNRRSRSAQADRFGSRCVTGPRREQARTAADTEQQLICALPWCRLVSPGPGPARIETRYRPGHGHQSRTARRARTRERPLEVPLRPRRRRSRRVHRWPPRPHDRRRRNHRLVGARRTATTPMTTTALRLPCGVPEVCHGPWPRLTTVERAKPPLCATAGPAGLLDRAVHIWRDMCCSGSRSCRRACADRVGAMARWCRLVRVQGAGVDGPQVRARRGSSARWS